MKLDFIIVSLPRSGTTWAANWLTTDNSICWHDPVRFALPHEMDSYPSSKLYRGISCTASWAWKSWFENHPARKLILDRDIDEVNDSLEQIGMPRMRDSDLKSFLQLEGKRIQFSELFTNGADIWEFLMPGIPFDEERHAQLSDMNIQPVERVQVPDAGQIKRALADLSMQLR